MEKQIFKESFYQDAVRQYQNAVNQAKNDVAAGSLKRDVIVSNLSQAEATIKDTLLKGYEALRDDLKKFMREAVRVERAKSSDQQRSEVAKKSDRYLKHDTELAETYSISQSMLWIAGEPHNVHADFSELVKGYK